MDAFWKEPNFVINRLLLECTSVESTLYKHCYFSVLIIYQSRLDTGWTLHIYRRKITFSTVGIMLGQLFLNIVPTLVISSRSPTLDQHSTDRHSRQSVMISAWDVIFSIRNYFLYAKEHRWWVLPISWFIYHKRKLLK